MMKNFNVPLMIAATALLLTLSGCGSSSNKKTAPAPAPAPSQISTPTPVTPPEVHTIAPESVAQYVEDFKQKQTELELQYEGEIYKISLVEIYQEHDIIAAKYEKGFVLFGFDLEKGTPSDVIGIHESTLEIDEAIQKADRSLLGAEIEISEEDDNIIYSGTVVEKSTGDTLNARLVFNESLIEGGSSTIVVEGTKARINGILGTKTYVQITDLINNHPEVDTLVLQQIEGSLNDDINMHTGRLVRNANLTTQVEATSSIHSGGVDLYTAGVKRVYTEGAEVGVHSWCCVNDTTADKLGRDHEGHGAQLTYFREMLGAELGPEFYFFTIESAPFDGIHLMTKAELDKYLL